MGPKSESLREQCSSTPMRDWKTFQKSVLKLQDGWIFRGNTSGTDLKSTLERKIENWGISLADAPGIEKQMIRDFRRKYRGRDRKLVQSDSLYCLALMQHHGAPTRLLDWTYSPFVAAKFAFDTGKWAKDSNQKTKPFLADIWALNVNWCDYQAGKIVGKSRIATRSVDETRNEETFRELFLAADIPNRFVHPEAPLQMNERLTIQQGIFLVPGDISVPFIDNVMSMRDWNRDSNLIRFTFELDPEQLIESADRLWRMNVNSAVLFPGLDGFAESFVERIPLFRKLAMSKTRSANV